MSQVNWVAHELAQTLYLIFWLVLKFFMLLSTYLKYYFERNSLYLLPHISSIKINIEK
jgi:hypothetical protein